MSEDLVVDQSITIPADELHWTFSTSGGPGGQHANRSNTKAELRFDLNSTGSMPPDLLDRARAALSGRLQSGVLVVSVDDTRSQWRNRQIARKRLAELLAAAVSPPPRSRRRTKPSRAAKRRRLESKRRRSEVKRLRKRPGAE